MTSLTFLLTNFLFLVYQNLSFQFTKNRINYDYKIQLNWASDEDMYDDNSYELLDLNKQISQPEKIYNTITIDSSNNNSPLIKFGQKKSKKDLLISNEEVIDFDGEDAWMVEVRDSIEQRIGRPIWTNKSIQQIKAEYRRNQALKAMRMPDSVRKLIEEVYIEKNIKMRDYPVKNKIAVAEYRKWLSEQKQKQANSKVKKSPLQMAKIEVSKQWLKQPLNKDGEPLEKPDVVHDELTTLPTGYSIGSNAKAVTMAAPNFFFSSVPQSLVTSSITQWEKSRVDYIQSQRPSSRISGNTFQQNVDNNNNTSERNRLQASTSGQENSVTIDGVEMFIASNVNKQDYYVLL